MNLHLTDILAFIGIISTAFSQELPSSQSQHETFLKGENIAFSSIDQYKSSNLKTVYPETKNFSLDSIYHKSNQNYLDAEYSDYDFDYKHIINYDTLTNIYSFVWYVYNHNDGSWLQMFKQDEMYIEDSLVFKLYSYDFDTTQNEWIPAYKHFYTYNEDNNLEQKTEYVYNNTNDSWNNSSYSITDYSYADDTTITITFYSWDDSESSWVFSMKNQVSTNKNKQETKMYNWKSTSNSWYLSSHNKYVYTNSRRNRLLTLYEISLSSDDTTRTFRNYYDNNENKILSIDSTMNYIIDIITTKSKTNYYYDEFGNNIKEIDSIRNDALDELRYSGITTVSYNKNNIKTDIHHIEYDEAGEIVVEVIHNYDYNKNKNKNYFYLEYFYNSTNAYSQQEYFYYYPVNITNTEITDTSTIIITFNDYLVDSDNLINNISIISESTQTQPEIINASILDDAPNKLQLTFNRKASKGEQFEITCKKGLFAAYDLNVSFSIELGNASHTGLSDNQSQKLSIYPTIATNEIMISSSEEISSFSIYNTQGNKVIFMSDINKNIYSISIENLTSGTYYISTQSNVNGVFIKK